MYEHTGVTSCAISKLVNKVAAHLSADPAMQMQEKTNLILRGRKENLLSKIIITIQN